MRVILNIHCWYLQLLARSQKYWRSDPISSRKVEQMKDVAIYRNSKGITHYRLYHPKGSYAGELPHLTPVEAREEIRGVTGFTLQQRASERLRRLLAADLVILRHDLLSSLVEESLSKNPKDRNLIDLHKQLWLRLEEIDEEKEVLVSSLVKEEDRVHASLSRIEEHWNKHHICDCVLYDSPCLHTDTELKKG